MVVIWALPSVIQFPRPAAIPSSMEIDDNSGRLREGASHFVAARTNIRNAWLPDRGCGGPLITKKCWISADL
jgi:hypothetical protein